VSLLGELMRRASVAEQQTGVQAWTAGGLAAELREAFYRRDASRFEMLLAVLERHAEADA
jgi:hypothetical protein